MTMTATYNLTARITGEEAEQIKTIKEKLGKSQHDIVRMGLKVYMKRINEKTNPA